MEEEGLDPTGPFFPSIDAKPGEYTLNDMVEWSQGAARRSLAEWLPQNKGTDRGVLEVELVNGFVDQFFPLVSDEGAEWERSLGVAEQVLHDLLNEEYDAEWPETEAEQIAFVERLVKERLER